MGESAAARLARIEEKLDGLDKRLLERCAVCASRVETLEQSLIRQGERLGKLEATEDKRKGGLAVMAALWAGAGMLGAVFAKIL